MSKISALPLIAPPRQIIQADPIEICQPNQRRQLGLPLAMLIILIGPKRYFCLFSYIFLI